MGLDKNKRFSFAIFKKDVSFQSRADRLDDMWPKLWFSVITFCFRGTSIGLIPFLDMIREGGSREFYGDSSFFPSKFRQVSKHFQFVRICQNLSRIN